MADSGDGGRGVAWKSFSLCAGVVRVGIWGYAAPCEGVEHLPHGAGLIACNHSTWLDGIVMACRFAWARYRPLHMIAYAEPFRHPLMGYILRSAGNIPLDRTRPEGTREAMVTALGYLERGEAVGMFPEGHLTRGPGLGRARPGLAMLALESGVPVTPTGLCGGDWVWPKGRRLPRWGWPGRRMVWRVGAPLLFREESLRYRVAGEEERGRLVWGVMERVMASVAALAAKEGAAGGNDS